MDPTELHGCGAARYQRIEDGAEKWAGVLPFTLQQGVVTEDGKLAGYSYSHGLEGNICPDGDPGEGTLNVVIVGPDGGVRLNDSRPRAVLTMHGSVEPTCVDLVLQEMFDRFVLMIAGRQRWEMYQLSTGRQLAPFRENFDFRRDGALRGAAAVRGRPLLLAHFTVFRSFSSDDSRFVLYDAEGREVWSKVVEADISSDPERPDVNLAWRVTRCSRFVSSTRDGQYELWSHSQQANLRFEVSSKEASRGEWKVREQGPVPPSSVPGLPRFTARNWLPGEFDARTSVLNALPPRKLRSLGSFSFIPSDARQNLLGSDLGQFDIDGHGRFGLVMKGPRTNWSFKLVSPNGSTLRSIDVTPSRGDLEGTVWVSGDRWLVWADGEASGAESIQAWWVNVAAGAVESIRELGRGRVISACRWMNDGVAFLIGGDRDSPFRRTVVAVDRSGQRVLPRIASDGTRTEIALPLETAGMAFTRSNQIALLIGNRVRLCSADGDRLGSWSISESLGRDPKGVGTLRAGPDGNLLLEDSSVPPSFLRLSADGTFLGEFTPRYPDGNPVETLRGFAVAPHTGEIWLKDAASLAQVDATGLVVRVVGSPPRRDRLTVVGEQSVDPYGRLHVTDRRTGAVHTFDGRGRRTRILTDPLLKARDYDPVAVRSSDVGMTIICERGKAGAPPTVLAFLGNSKRATVLPIHVDGHVYDVTPMLAPGKVLVEGYEFAYLVGTDGRLIKRIERRHGGHWLCRVRDSKVLPDGRILITSQAGEEWDSSWYASLFSSEGEPLSSTELPIPPRLSAVDHARGYFVYSAGSGFVWVDQKGQIVFRFVPRGQVGAALGWITKAESELWVLSSREGQMDRYAVPR